MNVLNQHISESFTLYQGDCVEVLQGFPSNSIHYSIFSPPFASLYTYSDSDRDMGNCKDDAEFQRHFSFLINELWRVLLPGRLVSVHCMNLPAMKSRDGFIGVKDFRGDIIRLFVSAGFIYHSEVCVWKNPVTEMQRTKALGLLHKQIRKDSSMSRQGLPDYVVTFRKPGDNPQPISHTPEQFPVDVWQCYASPVWMDIRQSNTLQRKSARDEKDEKHICPLQLDIIERCINLWSAPSEIVLDPFCGIGSVPYQAVQMGRKGLGVELKDTYFEQAVKNLQTAEATAKNSAGFDQVCCRCPNCGIKLSGTICPICGAEIKV